MKRLGFFFVLWLAASIGGSAERPNIVWIVGEDMGPELGIKPPEELYDLDADPHEIRNRMDFRFNAFNVSTI